MLHTKVWVEVPEFWEEALDRAAKMEGWGKRTDYIRDLIRNDLKRKGLLGRTAINEEVTTQ